MAVPKILRDDRGREAWLFQTPSGVHALIDNSISDAALAKFAESLKRAIARDAKQRRVRPKR